MHLHFAQTSTRRGDAPAGAPLTDAAIQKLREYLTPSPDGTRPARSCLLRRTLRRSWDFPATPLARRFAHSRRRACSMSDVATVRTSPACGLKLLLEGIAFAVDLMHEDSSLELLQVRRILEPAATALAASNINAAALGALEKTLILMQESSSNIEDMVRHDADFHAQVAGSIGKRDSGVDAQRHLEPHVLVRGCCTAPSTAKQSRGRSSNTSASSTRCVAETPNRARCRAVPRLYDRGVHAAHPH